MGCPTGCEHHIKAEKEAIRRTEDDKRRFSRKYVEPRTNAMAQAVQPHQPSSTDRGEGCGGEHGHGHGHGHGHEYGEGGEGVEDEDGDELALRLFRAQREAQARASVQQRQQLRGHGLGVVEPVPLSGLRAALSTAGGTVRARWLRRAAPHPCDALPTGAGARAAGTRGAHLRAAGRRA